MLARSSFDQAYIDGVRRRIEAQVAAYEVLAGAAGGEDAEPVRDFAPLFFGHLTIALEGCFVHRSRGKEAKKGPLKELRALSEAVADDGIEVSRERFTSLVKPCLEELEERFAE